MCVCVQVNECLEDLKLEAVQDNNVELVSEILGVIGGLKIGDDCAAELSRILQQPHFQVRNLPFTSRLLPSPLVLSLTHLTIFFFSPTY